MTTDLQTELHIVQISKEKIRLIIVQLEENLPGIPQVMIQIVQKNKTLKQKQEKDETCVPKLGG